MFKRGNGPLVSILFPTRGRPKWLCESVDTLVSLAKDKSLFEFIFKVDDDDKETIETVAKLSSILPCKAIISPRGIGYHQMHVWVNEMCALAQGDWLFIFNDDALMTTVEWDQVLLNYEIPNYWHGVDDVAMLAAATIDRPHAHEFLFVRKKAVDIMGHFSMNPHNDNWIFSIMCFIHSAFMIPIEIKHFSEIAEDETRQASESAYATTGISLVTPESIKIQIEDAFKLMDYIEKYKLKK